VCDDWWPRKITSKAYVLRVQFPSSWLDVIILLVEIESEPWNLLISDPGVVIPKRSEGPSPSISLILSIQRFASNFTIRGRCARRTTGEVARFFSLRILRQTKQLRRSTTSPRIKELA
jgi:hypothetical protein